MWQGTEVFDCPNQANEIILRHISFDSSVMGECNAGGIVGQSLRVDGNCYTSQLSVVYSESLKGKNVTCIHDNGIAVSSRISLMITRNSIGMIIMCTLLSLKLMTKFSCHLLTCIQFPFPPQPMFT